MRLNESLNNMSLKTMAVICAIILILIGIVSYVAYEAFNETYHPQPYQPVEVAPAHQNHVAPRDEDDNRERSSTQINRRTLELPAKVVTGSSSIQVNGEMESLRQLPADDVDDSPAHRSRWDDTDTIRIQDDFFQALNDRLSESR